MNLKKYCLFGIFCAASCVGFAVVEGRVTQQSIANGIKALQEAEIPYQIYRNYNIKNTYTKEEGEALEKGGVHLNETSQGTFYNFPIYAIGITIPEKKSDVYQLNKQLENLNKQLAKWSGSNTHNTNDAQKIEPQMFPPALFNVLESFVVYESEHRDRALSDHEGYINTILRLKKTKLTPKQVNDYRYEVLDRAVQECVHADQRNISELTPTQLQDRYHHLLYLKFKRLESDFDNKDAQASASEEYEYGRNILLYRTLLQYAQDPTPAQNKILSTWTKAKCHFITLENILKVICQGKPARDWVLTLTDEQIASHIKWMLRGVHMDGDSLQPNANGIFHITIPNAHADNDNAEYIHNRMYYQLPTSSAKKFIQWVSDAYTSVATNHPDFQKELQIVLAYAFRILNKNTGALPFSVGLGTSVLGVLGDKESSPEYTQLGDGKSVPGFIKPHDKGICIRIADELVVDKKLAPLALMHPTRLYYHERLGFHQDKYPQEAFQDRFIRELLFNELKQDEHFREGPEVSMSRVQETGNAYIQSMYKSCDDIAAQWGIIPVVGDDKQLHIFFLEGCDNNLLDPIYMGSATQHAQENWNDPMPAPEALKAYCDVMLRPVPKEKTDYVNLHPRYGDDLIQFLRRIAKHNPIAHRQWKLERKQQFE